MNPVRGIINSLVVDSPLPSNLTYLWGFGSILGLALVVQILTGVFLAMHYVADTELAFMSVEHIMRDTLNGWILRYAHSNGAGMFFIVVYIHMARGLYYGSYRAPRVMLWSVGVVIFLIMMGTAFIGYVLPWGQMSFWGEKDRPIWLNTGLMLISSLGGGLRNRGRGTEGRKKVVHNKDVLSTMVGTLLGDSYGERRSGGVRLVLQQESSNVGYMMWFHKYLAERGYCREKEPKKEKRIGKGGKVRYYYRVRTYTYGNLGWLYDLFYDNKKKVIRKELEEWINPLSLAIWIMDDGGRVSGGLKLATNGFEKGEVELLRDMLNRKLRLETSINRSGKDWVIYVPKRNMEKLAGLVRGYIHETMRYKLGGYL